jgi:hypothetical protein
MPRYPREAIIVSPAVGEARHKKKKKKKKQKRQHTAPHTIL